MTTARPILFSAPMIRALLAGTKTQTRRIAKPCKDRNFGCELSPGEVAAEFRSGDFTNSAYGKPGDLLWVRESCSRNSPLIYRADFANANASHIEHKGELTPLRWRPSIHMPRIASRLTLTITDVRIERLQSISEADAEAEGVKKVRDHCYVVEGFGYDTTGLCHSRPSIPYAQLWDHINGPGAWDANPWVVALTFTVHRQNVDEFLAQRQEAA